jgi:putative flippase GtrA
MHSIFETKKARSLLGIAQSVFRNYKNLLGYFIAALGGVIVQYLIGTTLLVNHLRWETVHAFWVGYIVSIPVGFVLTKLLAFNARRSGQTRREMLKYLITIVISGCITVYGADASIKILMKIIGPEERTLPYLNYTFRPAGTLGHFMGMGFSFIFNFIVHKKFTFHTTGLWDKLVKSFTTKD